MSLVSDLAGPSDGDGASGAVQLSTIFFESFHNIREYYLGLLLLLIIVCYYIDSVCVKVLVVCESASGHFQRRRHLYV